MSPEGPGEASPPGDASFWLARDCLSCWDLYLGRDIAGVGTGVSWSDLEGHVLIAGLTGRGKTTLVKRLLYEAGLRGVRFLVLDWEGEYSDLAVLTGARLVRADDGVFDLFSLGSGAPGVVRSTVRSRLLSILDEMLQGVGYELRPQMKAVLDEALGNCMVSRRGRREEGFECLEREIWRVSERYPSGRRTAVAVVNRLRPFFDGPLRRVFSGGSVEGFLGESLVIDLSPVAGLDPFLAGIAGRIILLAVYFESLNRKPGGGVRNILVVEEAEELFPRVGYGGFVGHGRALVSSLLHARKRGVSLVFVTHGFQRVDSSILWGTGSTFVFNLVDSVEARLAAERLGDEGLRKLIPYLGRGEALVRLVSSPRAFLLRVEVIEPLIDEAKRAIIESIVEKPFLGQRERRSLLGMDGRRYRRAIEGLVREGLIEVVEVYTGAPGRPRKLLNIRGRNPSILHEYIVYEAKRLIETIPGARILEVNKLRGPDIVLEYRGARIAVEVETGSSLDEGKILLREKEGFDVTIILCASRKACSKAGRLLSRVKLRSMCLVASSLFRLRGDIRRSIRYCRNTSV